ncbi:MAG: YggT family protein [Nitrosomonas sp.]|uniref:YggT family protein n=1 Tax=Nitrosomonas sp. TaxID=42353 RepID=UPI0026003939|nr:YggT family protein [Nitrosomonas sp.]MCG7757129.1 YggT family protein [Nitrosomonas sp.]UJP02097.1 MAG: YggT family protein [Nitrosomonas sp.]UJP06828.1 MAG: YggT family protein [Nitrosomonas sp.]
MSNQILIFLVDTILGLFSLALLLRFYFQLLRVPYYNSVSQFLIAVTDFIVRPARRFIPGWAGIDLSTLVLAWLLECIIIASMYMVQGYDFEINIVTSLGVMGLLGIVEIIKTTLYIVLMMIIMQAVLSWVNPHSPLAPLLDSFTRPFLAVFRKRIPPVANVDLSPLFVLILIQVLLMVVAGVNKEIVAMLL